MGLSSIEEGSPVQSRRKPRVGKPQKNGDSKDWKYSAGRRIREEVTKEKKQQKRRKKNPKNNPKKKKRWGCLFGKAV